MLALALCRVKTDHNISTRKSFILVQFRLLPLRHFARVKLLSWFSRWNLFALDINLLRLCCYWKLGWMVRDVTFRIHALNRKKNPKMSNYKMFSVFICRVSQTQNSQRCKTTTFNLSVPYIWLSYSMPFRIPLTTLYLTCFGAIQPKGAIIWTHRFSFTAVTKSRR